MKEQLKTAMKEAMKAKDQLRLTVIRSILSAIQYEEMQKGVDDIDEKATIGLIQSLVKKNAEEREFAEKSNREENLEQLRQENEILSSFLPAQLDETTLEQLITKMKEKNTDIQLGDVMKSLKESHAGQYDGKMASEVARRVLS